MASRSLATRAARRRSHGPVDDTWLQRLCGDVNARTGGGVSALHAAAERGDLPLVKEFIRAGADTTALTDALATPLAVARSHQRLDVVRYLFDCSEVASALEKQLGRASTLAERTDAMTSKKSRAFRGRVRAASTRKTHELLEAARRGDLTRVRSMVETEEVDKDAVDRATGESALSAAVEAGRRRVCEYLLTHGASVHAPCVRGGEKHSAMMCATLDRDDRLVRQLLAHGTSSYHDEWDGIASPLGEAARSGAVEVVAAMLEFGVALPRGVYMDVPTKLWFVWDPNAVFEGSENTAWLLLAIACWQRRLALVRFLFAAREELHDPHLRTHYGRGALMLAVYKEDETIVQELFRRGFEALIDDSDAVPVVAAVLADSTKVLAMLLEKGASVDGFYYVSLETRRSLLTIAVQSHAIDCLELLLSLGNYTCDHFDEAIFKAVEYCDPNSLALLLDVALPSTRAVLRPCIELAVQREDLVTLELLLSRCAIETQTELDELYLRACFMCRDTATIDLFLAYGADANCVSRQGSSNVTALSRASINLAVSVVPFLLAQGVRPELAGSLVIAAARQRQQYLPGQLRVQWQAVVDKLFECGAIE